VLFLFALLLVYSFRPQSSSTADQLTGAWTLQDGGSEHLVVFAGNYFTYTNYNKSARELIASSGGVWEVKNNQLIARSEFDFKQKDEVGKSKTYTFSVSGDNLNIEVDGSPVNFQRVDNGSGPLAGTWRITGRMQDGKMSPTSTGARKTLKIMSGTRFQWAAINAETKEFFGTGGGTYTFSNGKYTENIEFFSRDSSRVGMSLSFDGKVESGDWHHSGKSSKGEPIHEVWSKVK
jgi:hypothetical protein